MLLKYAHFNGLKFRGALNCFLSLYDFVVQKCKNQRFEENKGFQCSFYRIEVQVVTTRSGRLE